MSEDLKKAAALAALELVRPGMRLGLGTGSTAKHFVDGLGAKVAAGLKVICVATSEATQAQAEGLSIPMSTLDETPELDLTIDGADEIDSALRLIKGGGAALLREKIVAAASKRMIVIADTGKQVETLGRFPLPIEVVPFGLEATRRAVAAAVASSGASGELKLRKRPDGSTLLTDGGHYILDAHLGRIELPEVLALALNQVPGVVEHGLFLGLATAAFLAGADGVRVLGDPAVERR
ncbi:ribose-5-phosphate isomerase RpiA [Bosea sp. (in: a-proteobacteria)]|uniref:ribose-5-phosphate isomerase RpiA n=1 Tax=Bosea sp. (in: a-proteobacteria) TaxID=1871050 RepID=UPI001E0AF893|nr:ribose-5-phosphate isomerase RpiA [Bosea sp. (in: a-proteobacteria)]MBA4219230.1 ribose 5-phosphate isomerase A [Methylobacterium sp.]MBR3189950.1 ribose-5-phosphate isomerase RpiA [Bosea sp. (in: a-proteobacteria)]